MVDLIRLLYWGGGENANYFASICKEKKIEVISIVHPRHYNQVLENKKKFSSSISKYSKIHKVSTLNIKKLKKIIPDPSNNFYISFDSPWIFNNELINNFFKKRIVNSHSTRLPKDRGGGGFSWRILNNDKFGVCLVHLINDSGIDKGDVLFFEEFIFPNKAIVPKDYYHYQFEREKKFLKKFLTKLINHENFDVNGQPKYLSTYLPRLSTEINGYINWDLDINYLSRFVNAFDDPYQGASTFLNNQKVYIKKTMPTGESNNHPFLNGIIIRKTDQWIVVSCEGGCLIVEKVLNAKKENILKNVKTGDRFITPSNEIDKAKRRFKINN